MAFTFTTKVDLSEFGEEWKDSYITVRRLTFGESKDLADFNSEDTAKSIEFAVKLLDTHFVEGKVWNGSETVDLTKEDIENLPAEVPNKVLLAVLGTPDPKSSEG